MSEPGAPAAHVTRGARSLPPERWQQIEALLDAALDLPPEQRPERLTEWCAGDPSLRITVEGLLLSCEEPTRLRSPVAIGAPLLAQVTLEARRAEPPTISRVGPYRIVRHLGSGGMGSVYLAERDDGQFSMLVALKLLRRLWSTEEGVVRRFVEERQIVARLSHPNVARLLDGGVTEDGQPFLVLEYVEGEPIDVYCNRRQLGVEDRLRLFEAVCEAVQYAHRNLIVHRDLKPNNLLVSSAGEVKLVDFGIAKLLSHGEAGLTRTGERLLTPEYASPEQQRGDVVTTATDIYSLGVVLYELLAGVRPGPAQEVIRSIGSGEPRSMAASVLAPADAEEAVPPPEERAAARGTTPERLMRRLRGDLDAIVRKAMREEPERRYATADQLAADIRRHLEHIPVTARSGARGYRIRRFLVRHRPVVVGVATMLLLLFAASAFTLVQARNAAAERDRATEALRLTTDLLAAADPRVIPGRDITARELLERAAHRVEWELTSQPKLQSELYTMIGRVYYGLGLYERADSLLTRSLTVQRARMDERDPRIAITLHALGMLRAQQGDNAAAAALQTESLEIRRSVLGRGHLLVVESLGALGFAYRRQRAFDLARDVYTEAIELARSVDDPQNIYLASSIHGLAASLAPMGEFDAAEPLFREAIAMMESRRHGVHPELYNAMFNLGDLYFRRGELAAADSVMRLSYAGTRETLGPRHPVLSYDLRGLAEIRHALGDLVEAEALYREAADIQREHLPPRSSRMLMTGLGLGEVLLDMGRYDEAADLLQEMLAIAEATQPRLDYLVGRAQLALGRAMSELGDTRDATDLLRSAQQKLAMEYGDDDPRVRKAREQLVEHERRRLQRTRHERAPARAF
jgi:eukaryotic-like serine/threonine-protein kinase